MENSTDGTQDAPYTFGLPVEQYINIHQHARLAIFKSRYLESNQWVRLDSGHMTEAGEYSANF